MCTGDLAENLHDKILAAARELATRRPVDQLTVTAIARAAGVSRRSVYRHVGAEGQIKELLAQEQPGEEQPNRDTRSLLLAAAEQVFAGYGYAGTTLDQVAAAAGLTKGAVYWHFASKSDLFLALLEQRLHQQLAGAMELARTAAAAPNPEEGLSALLAATLGQCSVDPAWPRLFLEFLSQSREPDVQARLAGFDQQFQTAIGDLIREFQDRGIVARDLDPFKLAVLFNAICNGLVQTWLIAPDQFDAAIWAPQLARILWRGIQSGDA